MSRGLLRQAIDPVLLPSAHTYTSGMEQKIDGRRARGDISRQRVAFSAANIATVTGLDSISMSKLSADTSMSKSGILTVYPTREAIQLAAIAEARKVFAQHVIEPASASAAGTARLRKIVDNWFAFVEGDTFTGGAFDVATSAEYASQSGVVADAIKDEKRRWIELLESELAVGLPQTAAARKKIHETAFKLDAFMAMGNVRYELIGAADDHALARTLCHQLIKDHA